MKEYLRNNLPWIVLVIIFLTMVVVNIVSNKTTVVKNPSTTRLKEINDSLEKQIEQDGTIIQFQKDYISRVKDTIFVYNNKTNTIIKNHNENIKDINYISTNVELINRINSSIKILDSIDKSTGFIIHRDTNRSSIPYPKSN